jgi:hypothetical protein
MTRTGRRSGHADSNRSSSSGQLETLKADAFTYTVTAASKDGQTTTASISDMVAGPPTADHLARQQPDL